MNISLDGAEVEIPCPSCGAKLHKSIGWIKRHTKLVCTCGARITLDTKQFKSEMAKVDGSLDALSATLKNFKK